MSLPINIRCFTLTPDASRAHFCGFPPAPQLWNNTEGKMNGRKSIEERSGKADNRKNKNESGVTRCAEGPSKAATNNPLSDLGTRIRTSVLNSCRRQLADAIHVGRLLNIANWRHKKSGNRDWGAWLKRETALSGRTERVYRYLGKRNKVIPRLNPRPSSIAEALDGLRQLEDLHAVVTGTSPGLWSCRHLANQRTSCFPDKWGKCKPPIGDNTSGAALSY